MSLRASRFPGSSWMRQPPPEGFGIEFQVHEDNSVTVRFQFDAHKEGPPGFAHGGSVGAVLDEAMGTAAFEAGRLGFTATMTVNYRASVPLLADIEVRARVNRIDGSKTYTSAEMLLPDGTVAADSTGLFIVSEKLMQVIMQRYSGSKE